MRDIVGKADTFSARKGLKLMGLFYYAWPASQISVCDQKCVNSWMVPRGAQSVVNFVLEIK